MEWPPENGFMPCLELPAGAGSEGQNRPGHHQLNSEPAQMHPKRSYMQAVEGLQGTVYGQVCCFGDERRVGDNRCGIHCPA